LAAVAVQASAVRVYNRTCERAISLVNTLGNSSETPIYHCIAQSDALADAALVLQATTVGMGTTPGDPAWTAAVAAADGALEAVAPDAVLVDLVYRPRETPWVHAARARGLAADDGLEMLVRQAAFAFERWTGRRGDVHVMRQAALAALEAPA
jgi:shikimate dehydrogenase